MEMQVLRNLPMLQGEHHLDQTADAGRRLQMTDIGLQRANQQRRCGFTPRPKHSTQRLHFDRVTERGSRAVGFDITDVLRDSPPRSPARRG